MSYSSCLKCSQAVCDYDKYCMDCQEKFGLPNLPDYQKDNFPTTNEKWEDWAKKQLEKDLTQ